MKNKILKTFLCFVLFGLLLITVSYAETIDYPTTVKENVSQYPTTGAFIIGSTRFDTQQAITASKLFKAGVNESNLYNDLGVDKEIDDTLYYYTPAGWMQLGEKPGFIPEEDAAKLEANLNIFFENNEVKTIQVPYNGNIVDVDDKNVKYENGRFVLPATTFSFTFTEKKVVADQEVIVAQTTTTNMDKAITTESGKVETPVIESVPEKFVAKVGNEYFEDLTEALKKATAENEVVLLKDVDLSTVVVVNKKVILDLNGKTIKNETDIWNDTTSSWSLISVREDGDLIIKGNGTLQAKNGDCFAIDVQDGGKLLIDNGSFVGNISALYVYDGEATINGGKYSIQQLSEYGDHRYTLNCWDANYKTGDAKIIVNGGTFMNFNPAYNTAEGVGTNFVVEGNKIVKNVDKYTVDAIKDEDVALANGIAYTTLADAFANAESEATVKLLKDVDLSTVVVVNKKVILDLNEHTIKNETVIWNPATKSWSLISVREGGNLTIEGNGILQALYEDCYAVDVQGDGKLLIENGTFVGNVSAIYVHTGEATINGGTYSIQQLSEFEDYRYTLNCWDTNYKTGDAKIIVNGGTFMNFNPACNTAEGVGTNFVVEGNKIVKNVDKYTVDAIKDEDVALANGIAYTTLADAFASAENGATIKLLKDVEDLQAVVEVNKTVTLDLNGKTIKNETDIWNDTTSSWSLISVREDGDLIIKGNGTLQAKNGDCFAIDVQDGGKLLIENGTFVGNISALYVYDGEATINGGDYSIQQLSEYGDHRYTLNCWDANYKTGDAKIIVNGGTFTKFDPSNNLAEGPNTNFVPGNVE